MPALAQATIATSEASEKAFRSIGEASRELGLQTHVLRFWETKFTQLKPVKRGDGRRMYRPGDMQLLRALQLLLHEQGMTIKGAQQLIRTQGVEAVLAGDVRLTKVIVPMKEETPVAVSELSDNPVRRLQQSVNDAVEAGVFTAEDDGAADRLKGLLNELNDVKVRLDAALLGKAA